MLKAKIFFVKGRGKFFVKENSIFAKETAIFAKEKTPLAT